MYVGTYGDRVQQHSIGPTDTGPPEPKQTGIISRGDSFSGKASERYSKHCPLLVRHSFTFALPYSSNSETARRPRARRPSFHSEIPLPSLLLESTFLNRLFPSSVPIRISKIDRLELDQLPRENKLHTNRKISRRIMIKFEE